MSLFRKTVARATQMPQSPFQDEATIGNILMQMRVLTREQLLAAIGRKAHHDDMLLGVLLKELGFCTDEQVAKAMLIQAKLRKGDRAEAALELMESRLDSFSAGEARITEAIECARERSRENNKSEGTGVWIVPFSPDFVKG